MTAHRATTASLTGQLLASIASAPTADDKDAAVLHLLDWLGCALAGAVTDTGQAMARAGGATGHPLSPMGRGMADYAFALGSFGSLLEMDDVHRTAILHPGPVIWPAVVACATAETADRAPEAALRGYEAMVRLGKSVGQGHYARFHNTSTCGGLGSAVAAAWMLALDTEQTQWAMAHALSTSGGLWECRNEPGATKHLHVAEAARRGVQAALAAKAGIAGPLRILEGAQGFFAGLAPNGSPEALLQKGPWALHDTSFKPWPACRHAHAAIDAALAFAKMNLGTPESIVIETYADAVLFCDRPTPTDPGAARFSLQHAVAVALADGPPTLAGFETPALGLPKYTAIREICTVAEDSAMTAAYPAHFGARLRVRAGGGETVVHIPDAWGDSENPMSADAIKDKFQMLAAAAGVDGTTLQPAALDPETGAFTLRALLANLPTPLTKDN
ncbi:MmgE/PrpD family protein [Flavimaricola marinus]|uniref:2-methylcitrate dehydratase n=1 Tax=Flavimaricola marinus TaxID=1819565 RepID=A0A238LEW5_9RHOB|nr:MmgE/PrpD family protein [Flavimaricola marinus]SMY08148.1 2-methylcitrate dehydratase [Flavimaricola marinus]